MKSFSCRFCGISAFGGPWPLTNHYKTEHASDYAKFKKQKDKARAAAAAPPEPEVVEIDGECAIIDSLIRLIDQAEIAENSVARILVYVADRYDIVLEYRRES